MRKKKGDAWGFLHVFGLCGEKYWIMSKGVLTDEDANKLMQMQLYDIDLREVGFSYQRSGMFFGELLRVECTKKKALQVLDRLNHGEDPITIMYGVDYRRKENE